VRKLMILAASAALVLALALPAAAQGGVLEEDCAALGGTLQLGGGAPACNAERTSMADAGNGYTLKTVENVQYPLIRGAFDPDQGIAGDYTDTCLDSEGNEVPLSNCGF
jgi:opacity protein-like surface antigen